MSSGGRFWTLSKPGNISDDGLHCPFTPEPCIPTTPRFADEGSLASHPPRWEEPEDHLQTHLPGVAHCTSQYSGKPSMQSDTFHTSQPCAFASTCAAVPPSTELHRSSPCSCSISAGDSRKRRPGALQLRVRSLKCRCECDADTFDPFAADGPSAIGEGGPVDPVEREGETGLGFFSSGVPRSFSMAAIASFMSPDNALRGAVGGSSSSLITTCPTRSPIWVFSSTFELAAAASFWLCSNSRFEVSVTSPHCAATWNSKLFAVAEPHDTLTPQRCIEEPRSTSSHSMSVCWDDHREERSPSVAPQAC
mmetsp:Transcript_31077/g.73297  ORF Transcript_31077/g.73297 Transcript_31077/m.73297 type:complete len:307 (-) Transcript_31077:357-1277(-)